MKYFFSISIILVSITSFGQKVSPSIDKKLLPGRWTSAEDKKYTIVVTDTTFIEYYAGEKSDSYRYKIDKDKLIKTDKQSGEISNYSIWSLTKQRLTLMYLDRGNLLKFIRNK